MRTAVTWVRFLPLFFCVYVCFFQTISEKLIQLRLPNVFQDESCKPIFWDWNVRDQGHKSQKLLLAWVFALL